MKISLTYNKIKQEKYFHYFIKNPSLYPVFFQLITRKIIRSIVNRIRSKNKAFLSPPSFDTPSRQKILERVRNFGSVNISIDHLYELPELNFAVQKNYFQENKVKITLASTEVALDDSIFDVEYVDNENYFAANRFIWLYNVLHSFPYENVLEYCLLIMLDWVFQNNVPSNDLKFESYSISERLISWTFFLLFIRKQITIKKNVAEQIVNSISVSIVDDYNALIERIFCATDKSIDWLVSSTLSRNTYLNPLFINLCYLQLVDSLAKNDKEIGKLIVFDKILKEVLDDKFERNDINIQVSILSGKANFKERWKTAFRPQVDFYHNSKRLFLMWLLSSKSRKNALSKDGPITVIDTFFLSSMFKDNRFNDRYYSGLLEKLSENEKRDIFFTPELLIPRYKALKKALSIAEQAEERFIFRIDYLKIIDYFFALLSPIRIKKIKFDEFEACGFKVGPMLKSEFRRNILNWSSIAGLLNYQFFRRLKQAGVQLQKVVDWNENQVIDRGFNKGLKRYFPGTLSVGYQGYIISPDFNFYIHPTKYEYDAGVIPDKIAVVGKALIQNAKRFYKDLKVDVAPAFRFQGVWREDSNGIPSAQENKILVALPISFKQSEEIIRLIIDALSIREHRNLYFDIKPHPSLNMAALKKKFAREWRQEFTIVSGDFTERVKKCCLMLGNTSSTCVETLALGIPVIILGSQSGLTQNPIPKDADNSFWRLCYTPEELLDGIGFFLEQSQSSVGACMTAAQRIRKDCFESVTRSSVAKFLGSE